MATAIPSRPTGCYVVDHLPENLTRGRISLDVYRGGHMFYTNAEERAAFTANVKAFYREHPAAQMAE